MAIDGPAGDQVGLPPLLAPEPSALPPLAAQARVGAGRWLGSALCGGCFFAPPIPHHVPRRHPKKNSVFFLPRPISHHVHAQASGKIASRKIVCSCG
jgi:hypothetical protein